MGNPKAFINTPRKIAGYRPINERISDLWYSVLPLGVSPGQQNA